MTAPLAQVADIEDGHSKGFDPLGEGRDTMFIVRRGEALFGWRNACPHYDHARMAWKKDEFLTGDRARIVCGAHGAQFEIDTGLCVLGPCLGDRLTAVAEDFAAVGAPLMADDALARSLTLLPSDAPTARIADARRRVLAARVRPLCTARGPAVAEALTDRELAASVEAAGGATSREIAERAFVSRRTIENHLGRAYRKLQVDGRPGLTAALGAFVGGPRSGAC